MSDSLELNLLTGLSAGLLAISTLTVVLRMVVRSNIVHHVKASDWLMLIAQTLFTVVCGLSLFVTSVLRQSGDNSETAEAKIYVLIKALTTCYALCVTITKVSIGAWVPKTYRWQTIAMNVLLFIITVFCIVYLTMTYFPCGEQQAYLNLTSCNATVLTYNFNLAWSALNFAGAFAIVAHAITGLITSKASAASKWLGACALVVGLFGFFAAGARVLVLALSETTTEYERLTLGILAAVEAGTCIIAGCMAALRPLFNSCLGRETADDDAREAELARRYGEVQMLNSAKMTPAGTPKPEHVEYFIPRIMTKVDTWDAPWPETMAESKGKSRSPDVGFEKSRSLTRPNVERSTSAKDRSNLQEVVEQDRDLEEQLYRSRLREVNTEGWKKQSQRKRQAVIISATELENGDMSSRGSPLMNVEL